MRLQCLLSIGALSLTLVQARPDSTLAEDSRILYNGIELPATWPPQGGDVLSTEPMKVPYLADPPKVIPIDVGRQLFVDDFLVEHTDLRRKFHAAEKYAGNPVLTASTKAELRIHEDASSRNASGGTVALLHGGAFYDPADGFMKLWFSGARALASRRPAAATALVGNEPPRPSPNLPPSRRSTTASGSTSKHAPLRKG